MTRREQLAYMVDLIEPGIGSPDLRKAIDFAKANGIVADMHVGKSKEWFEQEKSTRVPEYFMGQFVSGYEEGDLIAYNHGINVSRKFLKEINH